MLRCLLRSFQLSLAIQPAQTQLRLPFNHQRILWNQLQQSIQFHTENFANFSADIEKHAKPPEATKPFTSEIGGEYIVPYHEEHERSASRKFLIEEVGKKLRLTESEAIALLSHEGFKRDYKTRAMLHTIDILLAQGVTKESFVDYPWLITMDHIRLKKKLVLLNTMPMRDINHFVAFLRLTEPRLRKLVNMLNRESKVIPQSNRVYYISKVLDTDPYIVSKYLSRRLFVLEMPFDQLEKNLQNMIEYKVSPRNVLRDLWAFRYKPKSVKLRFERATKANKEKIMPWMVRCPEPILQRSLKLSLDELAVLGDKTSVVEYVAERLQFDVLATKSIMQKHPQVFTVRVTKIKEVLDYLLDVAGFTRFEIAQNVRILCHSLETTKQRIDELKSHGCRPSSLVIVCRSKREYYKFLQKWLSMDKFGTTTVTVADVDADKKQGAPSDSMKT